MKHIIIIALLTAAIALTGCEPTKPANTLKFAVCADYPPFEYYENGILSGFDVEVGQLIARELKMEVEFTDMQFSVILPALQNGTVDAGISTVTITKERQKNFDFSDSYYHESLAIVYPKNSPLTNKNDLANKKIACQLGTTMEIWLKKHVMTAKISAMDNNNQAIESLKAGHVAGVLVDTIQAQEFVKQNSNLAYSIIAKSDNGYGIIMSKKSPLRESINTALKAIETSGELADLKHKWFGDTE